jgi:L-serine dehydratase
MESIRTLYKIGRGPSSSHTMGPDIASKRFKEKNKDADHFKVYLYGSLALTGRGHLTDYVIYQNLGKDLTEIIFDYDTYYDYHPNGFKLQAYKNNQLIDEELLFSVGGGSLKKLNEPRDESEESIYPHSTMNEILKYCLDNNINFVDYVKKYEDDKIMEYMELIYKTMDNTIQNNLLKEDVLPGSLKVDRKAHKFYNKFLENNNYNQMLFAYARSMAEANASGDIVVTTPTCGSCGIIPAVLLTYQKLSGVSNEEIYNALLVAGLIGNIVRTNGSISGAEVGCQGEVGVACSMAAAALTYLYGGTVEIIENAAEIALEHHLGLTCDPIDGLVQIPCIERNALAALEAVNITEYVFVAGSKHKVTLDSAILTMKETGKDLNEKYRETSQGGLALRK